MTPIAEFRMPVRAVLGDFDSVTRKYQDTAIDSVIQTLVKCGHLGSGYTLAGDRQNITPDLPFGNDFGRLVYQAAKTFIAPNSASYAYRTRALSESFGDQKNFLTLIENALHDIDSNGGAMFGTSTDFRSWFLSVSGLDPWEQMTDMRFNAPVATVTIGQSGLQVNG